MRPDFPFRPASLPFFYGWVIVVVGTLGIIMSVPGQTIGVSFFTDHVLDATGLTRLQFSNAYLLGTVASGLVLPYVGTLVDRVGVRRLVLAASVTLALTLVYLANCDHLARAAAERFGATPTLAAFVVLVVGFASLRLSGQGVLTLVSRTMLGRWFDRRRGLVAAISQPAVNFSFSAAPLLIQTWITSAGWRGAWIGMALIVGPGMGLLGWLLYRDTPEECGLRMDGAPPAGPGLADVGSGERSGAGTHSAGPEVREYTRAEALRTAIFWLVTLGVAIHAMIGTGVTFHIVDVGAEAGLSPRAAAAIFLPIAVVSVGVGFAVGALLPRTRIRNLMLVMLLGQLTYFVGVAYLSETWGFWLTVAGWGLTSGFFGPLTVAVLPALFGRKHLGAIQGFQMMCFVIASAAGPSLLAWFDRALGSYGDGMLFACALPALTLVVAAFAREPER